jgi:hypothetical protein
MGIVPDHEGGSDDRQIIKRFGIGGRSGQVRFGVGLGEVGEPLGLVE